VVLKISAGRWSLVWGLHWGGLKEKVPRIAKYYATKKKGSEKCDRIWPGTKRLKKEEKKSELAGGRVCMLRGRSIPEVEQGWYLASAARLQKKFRGARGLR